MKIIKKVYLILATVMLVSLYALPNFAEQLSSFTIYFNGPLPNAGDSVDDKSINISCDSAQIREYYWTNVKHDPWEAGDIPLIEVNLTPWAGYFGSSTRVYVNGYGAKLKSKRYHSRDSITCVIKLPAVKADGKVVGTPDDLFWEGNNTARWNSVYNATSYDVRLLRNGHSITTEHVSSTRFYFRYYLTREGDYTFTVRAKKGSKSGNWSNESDSIYIDEQQARRNASYEPDPTPSPSPITPSPSPIVPGPGVYTNYWRTDVYGNWHVYDRYNNLITNCWFCDDIKTGQKNQWYVIDPSGNLITNGLVRDAFGNYYSIETTPGENFGMIRNTPGVYNGVYIDINTLNNGRFGAINNMDAINVLTQLFGVTDISYIPQNYVYASNF